MTIESARPRFPDIDEAKVERSLGIIVPFARTLPLQGALSHKSLKDRIEDFTGFRQVPNLSLVHREPTYLLAVLAINSGDYYDLAVIVVDTLGEDKHCVEISPFLVDPLTTASEAIVISGSPADIAHQPRAVDAIQALSTSILLGRSTPGIGSGIRVS